MHIVYIQSYPIFHDGISLRDWIKVENRDKWMPAITSEFAENVELWVATTKSEITSWSEHSNLENTESSQATYHSGDSPHLLFNYPWGESNQVKIRVFAANFRPGNTKNHISHDMLQFAKKCNAQYYLIKGVDGGIGLYLIKRFLRPGSIPFAFIIGGKCDSKLFRYGHTIFYESETQLESILKPHCKFFKRRTTQAAIRRLPKSVDTDLFCPMDDIRKVYDIITTGRLIPYYKDYEVLHKLSETYKIAVIGGGPLLDEFRVKYKKIHWIGHVQHHEIPKYLNKARCFIYTSKKDYFPRAITEAAASGLPVIAFDNQISEDVIPPEIGLIVNASDVENNVAVLLNNPLKLENYSKEARKFAVRNWGKFSVKSQVDELISKVKIQVNK